MPTGIYKRSEQQIKKIIDRNKLGLSIKSRKKISEKHKGRIPFWLKGKKLSEKHKRKVSEAGRGEKNWNWKGGITPIVERIRKSDKYKKWRQDIYIRDNFTCQRCGIKSTRLEAHHIKSFSKLLQEVKEYLPLFNLYDGAIAYTPFWDISNGITLCKECHHKTMKKKNNLQNRRIIL
jgi:5-methylcytosine-specific restriction endonuclease McrA